MSKPPRDQAICFTLAGYPDLEAERSKLGREPIRR